MGFLPLRGQLLASRLAVLFRSLPISSLSHCLKFEVFVLDLTRYGQGGVYERKGKPGLIKLYGYQGPKLRATGWLRPLSLAYGG